MDVTFEQALLIVGLLLGSTAALSGWLRGTVLSISVLSVVAGIALAATGVIAVEPSSKVLLLTVELALVLTLFADGLFVENELLRHAWRPPARALVIAMPLTGALLAGAAKLLFDLTWTEAFLLGAVLSPTDPVVTSAVVTAQRVPAVIRHTLNLESGLNDGLALPFVLFFLALASQEGDPGSEAAELLGEAAFGAVLGIALALLAGRLLARLPGGGIAEKYEGIYALGLALLAFGLAEVTFGNGLIAVFVAGIALAVARHEMPEAFREFNESVSATFQVITFFAFGAVVVATGWDGSWLRLLAFIGFALLVARPLAVLVSFAGIGLPRPYKLFIAWFGPKGVASMLFALLVLGSTAQDRTLVFDVASFVVLASILAHGLTETVAADWIERRLDPRSLARDEDDVRERVEAREGERAAPVVPPAEH